MKPKIIMDHNSAEMHFWSKFGNPDFQLIGNYGMDKLKMV